MGFKIQKNTFKKGLSHYKESLSTASELAVGRGLEVIRSAIIPLVPVKSSRLKNSIGSKANDHEGVFDITTKNGKVIGTIGTNVPYARRVEFGFTGKDSLGRNYNQQGRYFFTNGFTLGKENARRTIINTLKNANRN